MNRMSEFTPEDDFNNGFRQAVYLFSENLGKLDKKASVRTLVGDRMKFLRMRDILDDFIEEIDSTLQNTLERERT